MSNDTSGKNRCRPVSAICALAVAAMGATILYGWFSGHLLLASLAPGWIPMAPSTALLFVTMGSTLLLRILFIRSRGAWITANLIASACGMIALILFALSSMGIHPSLEHLGMTITGSVNSAPMGHMSPVTAFCFVIAALSFLASSPSSMNSRASAITAWWLNLVMLIINVVFLLAYLYGLPLLYRGNVIPPAVNTITAFLALGAALFFDYAARAATPFLTLNGTVRSAVRLLLFIFGFLSCGIVTAGFLYYRNYEHGHRLAAEKSLASIADLKVAELSLWRQERLGDAATIQGNLAFSALVKRSFSDPGDKRSEEELSSWLGSLQSAYRYERVYLFDTGNTTRMAIPSTGEPPDPLLSEYAARAFRSGEVIFMDFHRHGIEKQIHLSLVVPIFDPTSGRRPLGVLVLRIDPEKYLYPFISRWPVPSKSGETLLVRRDGNEVVFLNLLRFGKEAPLTFRLPLSRKDLPAAKAVLGTEDVVEGRDYRGVAVVAALRHVPDSSWYLVAKMDSSEIYAPLRERLWFVIFLVGSLLIGAAAGVGLIWRQQSAAFYKEKFRAEHEKSLSEERYRTLVENAPIAIFVNRDNRIEYANPATVRLFGVDSDDKILGRSPYDFVHPKSHPAMTERIKTLLHGGSVPLVETSILRADGIERLVEVVAVAFIDPQGTAIQVMMQDITERKHHEKMLLEKNLELERLNYTVSHDLKSPLVTVKTFLGYLAQDLERGDNARIDQDMMYMRTAAERMGRLLEDLFNLSRLGRTSYPPIDVSFSDLVREAASLVAGRISQRGVRVALGDSRVMLHGDRQRLLQLWQNLIDNAVKFMGDQAEPLVEVGVETGSEMEPVFFVKDNGQGIDPRYREKIFGLFEQLDPGFEGTGIGLALVKRIVDLYGGELRMESEGPGKGTTFHFTLPKAMKIQ